MIRFLFLGALMASASLSAQVGVTYEFSAGTPARAAEVNQNFQDLVGAINALQATVDNLETVTIDQAATIATLESTINDQAALIASLQTTVGDQGSAVTTLETGLAAVQANTVLQLDGYLSLGSLTDTSYQPDEVTYPVALFEGINVQVVDGSGTTDGPPGGTGNLIVGYNEPVFVPARGGLVPASYLEFCAEPAFDDQANCEGNGYFWGANQRRGSHNLIIGKGNGYSQYGALIAGRENIVSGYYGTLTGGILNIVRGTEAHISAGTSNQATGIYSSVSGGASNIASGDWASLNGGTGNTASGLTASVLGGQGNIASGNRSTVSGGSNNEAAGLRSSVSGGANRTVTGENDWGAGSLFEDF